MFVERKIEAETPKEFGEKRGDLKDTKKPDSTEYSRKAFARDVGDFAEGLGGGGDIGNRFNNEGGDVSQVSLSSDIPKKKKVLGESYAQLLKKDKQFKEADAARARALKPILGTENESLLLESLDREFNPKRYDGQKPPDTERSEKLQKAVEKLDERTDPQLRGSMHRVVYCELLKRRIGAAENELNGAVEQGKRAGDEKSERRDSFFALVSPDLRRQLAQLPHEKKADEDGRLRSLYETIFKGLDEKGRKVAEDYISALRTESLTAKGAREMVADGERSIRTDIEAMTRALELPDEEKMLAQFPEAEGAKVAQKEKQRMESDA